jgi:predicted Zn-dependent peptidase
MVSFPWIDLPMAAFTNWYNSHNFYGDLKDIEAATLEDAKTFATKYYQPQNAVLVVVGDFAEADAKRWVENTLATFHRRRRSFARSDRAQTGSGKDRNSRR